MSSNTNQFTAVPAGSSMHNEAPGFLAASQLHIPFTAALQQIHTCAVKPNWAFPHLNSVTKHPVENIYL